MIFHIPSMACGHCVSTLANGIKAKDPMAVVTADLELKLMTVQSTLDPDALQRLIRDEGYEASAA